MPARMFVPAAVLVGVLFPWLLSGCLTFSATETRIFLDDNGISGRAVFTYYGLESDSDSPEEQASDFQDLIATWSYRDNLEDEGFEIDRQLWVEDGKLNGACTVVFANLDSLFKEDGTCRVDSTGIHATLRRGDFLLAEHPTSNGQVREEDGTVTFTWPPGSRELWIREDLTHGKGALSPATTAFADSFQVYLKNRSVFDEQMHALRSHMVYAALYDSRGEERKADQEREEACLAFGKALDAGEADMKSVDPQILDEAIVAVEVAVVCPEQRLRAVALRDKVEGK